MKILIVSATAFEIAPLEEFLKKNFRQTGNFHYTFNDFEVSLLITGVGLPLTAYALGKAFSAARYDLSINMGIAGAFDRELKIGDVVQVIQEEFADLGVEEADGSFVSANTLGLIADNQPPFINGVLVNQAAGEFSFLPKAKGISVNKVHGSEASIEKIKKLYDADVESMEGAAFFYACLSEQLPFLQIRAISNYVEKRNKDNWDIPLAISNLNDVVKELLQMLMVAKEEEKAASRRGRNSIQ